MKIIKLQQEQVLQHISNVDVEICGKISLLSFDTHIKIFFDFLHNNNKNKKKALVFQLFPNTTKT
jgi:hypothetical protein